MNRSSSRPPLPGISRSRKLLVSAAVAGLVLAGCAGSSDDDGPGTAAGSSTSAYLSTNPDGTSTGGATRLQTPDTLADGSFPPVSETFGGGPLDAVTVRLTPVAEVDSPMAMVARPNHPDQLFIAERAGLVRLATIDDDSGDLDVADEALLDLSDAISTDGEMGLLGLAFAPDGNTLYLSYNLENNDSRVDAAPVTDTADGPRIGTPTALFEVDQPETVNHKGGQLVVDADGLLYAGFGDGGGQGDPDQRAQDPDQLLGKMLRVDPAEGSGERPYGIPVDNPHADGADGAPEIYLTGLRNPWRFSIDPENGDLWIADVGQDDVEEINRLPGGELRAGANLGWSGHEGTRVFDADRIADPSVPPIFEISHDDGVCSVTGGVVYRGTALPDLQGAYLYADLCRSGIEALRSTTPTDGIGEVTETGSLGGTGDVDQIIAFATDAEAEVYVLSMNGTIHRLDPAD